MESSKDLSTSVEMTKPLGHPSPQSVFPSLPHCHFELVEKSHCHFELVEKSHCHFELVEKSQEISPCAALSRDDAAAEVKASSPIRISLFERESSMWGRLKRPSPRHSMVDDSRSDDSDFCHEMLSKYGFTPDQMHRAAERYRLGRSKSGKTIFWMIDDLGICRDGHIATSWVSQMLKLRYPTLAHYIRPHHCLFGLHLLRECHSELVERSLHSLRSVEMTSTLRHSERPLSFRACREISEISPLVTLGRDDKPCATFSRDDRPIGVVESERSAVILSEFYPDLLWLAYAYPSNLTVDQFAPLQGRTVTLFPRAAPDEFLAALELADQVRRTYRNIDISVSSFLEDHATDAQKQCNIDLVDFLFNL